MAAEFDKYRVGTSIEFGERAYERLGSYSAEHAETIPTFTHRTICLIATIGIVVQHAEPGEKYIFHTFDAEDRQMREVNLADTLAINYAEQYFHKAREDEETVAEACLSISDEVLTYFRACAYHYDVPPTELFESVIDTRNAILNDIRKGGFFGLYNQNGEVLCIETPSEYDIGYE